MKKAEVLIVGSSPMVQGRYHNLPKNGKESHDAYEERTWKDKAHSDDGIVLVPGEGIKKSLDAAVQRLGIKTKGSGTMTKHFKSGVRTEDLYYPTSIKLDDVRKLSIFCEVSKGSGTRVLRHFPETPSGWKTLVVFLIVDDMVTKDVFMRCLKEAGQLVGIGSFRVENGGRCGTFKPELKSWEDFNDA